MGEKRRRLSVRKPFSRRRAHEDEMADDYVRVTCHACEGAGCTYCDRRGWVEVRPPATACPTCEGDCCIYCGYTGWAGLRPKYDDPEAPSSCHAP